MYATVLPPTAAVTRLPTLSERMSQPNLENCDEAEDRLRLDWSTAASRYSASARCGLSYAVRKRGSVLLVSHSTGGKRPSWCWRLGLTLGPLTHCFLADFLRYTQIDVVRAAVQPLWLRAEAVRSPWLEIVDISRTATALGLAGSDQRSARRRPCDGAVIKGRQR